MGSNPTPGTLTGMPSLDEEAADTVVRPIYRRKHRAEAAPAADDNETGSDE